MIFYSFFQIFLYNFRLEIGTKFGKILFLFSFCKEIMGVYTEKLLNIQYIIIYRY